MLLIHRRRFGLGGLLFIMAVCIFIVVPWYLVSRDEPYLDWLQIPPTDYNKSVKTPSESKDTTTFGKDLGPATYYKELFDLFHEYRPNLAHPLDNYKDKAPSDSEHKHTFDIAELLNYLQVKDTDLSKIKTAHMGVVDHLPTHYPEQYYNGTGIVIVGGGRFMPIAISCIRLLRRINLDIPVEVFLPGPEEYEEELCDRVFPSLNAKCVMLEDRLGKNVMTKFKIKGYQYKGLALLVSSFENVLLLDSDNIPVRDPMNVFNSDPYKSTGYILWPDFWQRTTSPYFYSIAGVEVGERIRGDLTNTTHVPLHHLNGTMPETTSESGQVAVSKRLHFRSLLLSTYYNLYGYDVFYPLLSQGALGEGDKETFAAAATVLKEPVYYIQSHVAAGGFHSKKGFKGVSMLQADPQLDFNKYVAKTTTKDPLPIFVHNHWNKMNPMKLVLDNPLRYPNRDMPQEYRIRFHGKKADNGEKYGTKGTTGSGNEEKVEPVDIELEIWEEAKWMVCDMALKTDKNFKVWEEYSKDQFEDVCDRIKSYITWLIDNPNPEWVPLPDEKEEEES